MTAISGASGAAIVRSPLLAVAPIAGLVLLGFAVVSVDGVLFSIIAVRNFTDLGAVSTTGARGIDPSAAIGIAVLGLAALRLGNPRFEHRFPRALLLLLVGLGAWFAIAVADFGFDASFTRELIRSSSIVAIGVMATVGGRRDAFERTAKIVLLAAVVPAIVAVVEAASHAAAFSHGDWRSHATFAHENTAAVAFGVCATLSLWFLRRHPSAWYRAGILLFSAALITTGSLGGFAQAVVALLALRQGLTGVQQRRRRRGLVLVIALVAVFAATPLGQGRLSSLSATHSPVSASQGQYSNSLDWRFLNWSKFIQQWERKPVLGLGLGTTTSLVLPLGKWTHSDYVRLLVETGIVGTLLFGGLGLLLVRSVRTASRGDPEGHSGAAVLYALLLGLMTHALVETVSLDTAPMYMIAALIGAAFAQSRGSIASTHGWRAPI